MISTTLLIIIIALLFLTGVVSWFLNEDANDYVKDDEKKLDLYNLKKKK